MKKFLTMLLALSVVFTYTFGAAGSVFAATEYTVASARAELDTVVANYTESVAAAKKLAMADYTYDSTTGLCNNVAELATYDKAAVDAAGDAIEAAAKKALAEKEEASLESIDNTIKGGGTVATLSTYKTDIQKAVVEYKTSYNLTTKDGYMNALKVDTLTLNVSA